MKFRERLPELRRTIERELAPLVDRPCRLLEIPDYPNPGDILIYEGERAFLKKYAKKCIEHATMTSFSSRNPRIPKDELMILRGGGYFGDLWPMGPAFQAELLERYPDNPMVMFPQSVCFTCEESVRSAVERYGAHGNLTICLRDRMSYDFVRSRFPNNVKLVPDFAFYADVTRWRHRAGPVDRRLALKRVDAESVPSPALDAVCAQPDTDVADWPLVDKGGWTQSIMSELRRHPVKLARAIDWWARNVYRPVNLASAVRFLEPYAEVHSTRLHGCLLALLMGKTVKAYDNSTRKISALVETWLDGVDEIEVVA